MFLSLVHSYPSAMGDYMKYYKENTERTPLLVLVVALCFLLLLGGEAEADNWYAEVGVGYIFPKTPWGTAMNDNLKYDWKGSNPAAVFEVGRRFDNGLNVYYQHISNWRTGFPVNDKSETGIDMVVMSYRFKW